MDIQKNVPLAAHTTFAIGGPAAWYVSVTTPAELQTALAWAQTNALPVFLLGGGSNVLVSDAGFAGLVIKNMITGVVIDDTTDNQVTITVGAGEVFDELVARSVAEGWWGLENLSHIPGSVGATPIQNVGAYGVEVGNVVQRVQAIDIETGEAREFTKADCQFAYRDSFFKTSDGRKYAITHVTFTLSTIPQPKCTYKDLAKIFSTDTTPSLTAIRAAVISIRSKKFPDWTTIGTAGSFFKNPIISQSHFERLQQQYPALPGFVTADGQMKIPLAYVLDKVCGMRGWRDGAVGSYEGQALVVVNYGGASAAAVEDFAQRIAKTVLEKTTIAIEWEVTQV